MAIEHKVLELDRPCGSTGSPTVQGDVYFGRVTDFIIGNGLLFYAQTVIPGSDPESVDGKVLCLYRPCGSTGSPTVQGDVYFGRVTGSSE